MSISFLYKILANVGLHPSPTLSHAGRGGKTACGFTLVEMLVAVALFAVVMTIAVGALMSVVGASRRAQASQAIIDNLDFALEDMSRVIRTGTTYYCGTGSPIGAGATLAGTSDNGGNNCDYVAVEGSLKKNASGVIIQGDSTNWQDQIVYWVAPNCGATGTSCIEKSTDGGRTFLPITSPEIQMLRLSLYVKGSSPKSSGDSVQPQVTLLLQATVQYQNQTVAHLNIETSMTQRLYDI